MSVQVEKLLVAAGLAAVACTVFAAAAHWNGADPAAPPPVALPIDAAVPAVPVAVWVYLSWYVAPLLVLRADLPRFRRTAAAVLLAFLVCAAGWVFLPARIDRPQLDAAGGLSIRALRELYAVDPPVNLFPSFHAALAAIVARIPLRSRAVRWVATGWMLAIWGACVLTRQHYLLDVGSGALVGFVAGEIVNCPAAVRARAAKEIRVANGAARAAAMPPNRL